MAVDSFGAALNRLWPHGDEKVHGLRSGMIATAPAVFQKYKITSPLVLAHIMAQVSHECGAGHDVIENLNYTAVRMTQVWPSRFPTVASAAPYAGNPQKLANKVYNGRMGNALGSNDGWFFRGRGGSQTTGRDGYLRVKRQTGLDVVATPDILIDPIFFLECAVSDFINCGCMPFALADDIVSVTRHLNGGLIGLDQRRQWLTKWKAANVAVPSPPLRPVMPVAFPSPPLVPDMPDDPRPDPVPQVTRAPPLAPAAPPPGRWASMLASIMSVFKRSSS